MGSYVVACELRVSSFGTWTHWKGFSSKGAGLGSESSGFSQNGVLGYYRGLNHYQYQ